MKNSSNKPETEFTDEDKKRTEKQILAKYGSKFKEAMNPQIRNIRTGKICTSAHHCPQCGKAATWRCYKTFHLGFCLERIRDKKSQKKSDKKSEKKKKGTPLVICGVRFAVQSSGCDSHPYHNGCNQIFKKMAGA